MGHITHPYSVRWRVGPIVDMRTWRCGKANGLAQGYMGSKWWKIHFYLTPKWEWGLDRARLMRWACVCVWGVVWGHPNTKPLPPTSYHTDCEDFSIVRYLQDSWVPPRPYELESLMNLHFKSPPRESYACFRVRSTALWSCSITALASGHWKGFLV